MYWVLLGILGDVRTLGMPDTNSVLKS